jgi:D-3-phosphoglycerate dehydrogenase / 2-oxoglutarate reductase
VATNKKRVLVPHTMAAAGFEVLKSRDDVAVVTFPNAASSAEFNVLLRRDGDVNAAILGLTRFGEEECAGANGLQVVARIGVGYDTVDVPALTRHHVPLMIAGTANSPSVAEQAMHFMMALAKRGAFLHGMVQTGKWRDGLTELPVDLIGKTVLVIGFGRIGTRTSKRCQAMEMNVLIYDPYVPAESVRAAGYEPVADLDAALPRADFVTIHCPKTPETIGMFGTARLGRMKKTAYLVNTARGGIIDEKALHAALTGGVIAGAGLDVFDQEPTSPDNPLLKLATVISAPHMAGVTREAVERMAAQAALNVLSVFDGQPIRQNVVNPEVLG